jgi:hypothetical protein
MFKRLLKKRFFAGCSKMLRCLAYERHRNPAKGGIEIMRSEAYLGVRRHDDG